ncbi:hypothetical protein GWI33_016563 [Rhynchophorus ferrugineus]|uniref:Uncharacterized protein n=1 Tax=Rhynchophorus ferrugineus TaxID=354439 RepID=A0A834I107_RHYFE|nr:hypothetical protein GWI33_016563 [Rhynchophorus ferrugineus]
MASHYLPRGLFTLSSETLHDKLSNFVASVHQSAHSGWGHSPSDVYHRRYFIPEPLPESTSKEMVRWRLMFLPNLPPTDSCTASKGYHHYVNDGGTIGVSELILDSNIADFAFRSSAIMASFPFFLISLAISISRTLRSRLGLDGDM